jgi:hypothetical protein
MITAIPDDPMLTPNTDRCRCMACGLYFNSSYAFGEHRVGNWESRGENRHCLTLDEMTAKGWSQMERGHWVPRRMPASAVQKRVPAADP